MLYRPHERRLLIRIRKIGGSGGGREVSRGWCCVQRTSGIRGLIPFYEVVKIYPKILVLAIFFV